MFSFSVKPIGFLIASWLALPAPLMAETASTPPSVPTPPQKQPTAIINYSTQPQAWQDKLQQLASGQDVKFRILQLGDSHTAGGFWTDKLRQNLQKKWGDGGLGWVFPSNVSGQRMAMVDYTGSAWKTLNSRRDAMTDFPLGGIVARSQANQILQIAPKNTSSIQNMTLAMRPILANGALSIRDAHDKPTQAYSLHGSQWQYFSFQGATPIKIQTQASDLWELGGISFENPQKGVIVSALGLNGAQLLTWNRWRHDWENDLVETQADLVILAYGTNEAFNDKIHIGDTKKYWHNTIQRIRQTLPNAGILIVGAPESLKSTAGECGSRPIRLSEIQKMQQEIAQEQGLLFWSWQDAMGGLCGMKKWIDQKWARADGVHFSPLGYEKTADELAAAIIQLSDSK